MQIFFGERKPQSFGFPIRNDLLRVLNVTKSAGPRGTAKQQMTVVVLSLAKKSFITLYSRKSLSDAKGTLNKFISLLIFFWQLSTIAREDNLSLYYKLNVILGSRFTLKKTPDHVTTCPNKVVLINEL
jgi:hypothetical protein